jgi:hypothetical protein
MKRARWILANSPAIAISMVALVFALGSGAGYAASTASSSGQPVFHELKLQPFWTGHARYAVVDGIVYLSGLVVGHKKGAVEPLRLPQSVAPRTTQTMPIWLSQGDGGVDVGSDGEVLVLTPTHHGAAGFLSLAGVSYPIDAP